MVFCVGFGHWADAGTFRDNFSSESYSRNDGTLNWSGSWVESDPQGGGASDGNVQISNGFLKLNDYPDSGTYPSAHRCADLNNSGHGDFNVNLVRCPDEVCENFVEEFTVFDSPERNWNQQKEQAFLAAICEREPDFLVDFETGFVEGQFIGQGDALTRRISSSNATGRSPAPPAREG